MTLGHSRRAALAILALTACSGDPAPSAPAIPPDRGFPKGFLWSVATSAQESEGDNVNSDWDAFAALGKAPPAGKAQNAYELYDVDDRNAASLHLNSFQLTIEWARLVPKKPADPTAPVEPKDVDPKEVAHYHAVLKSMHDADLTPVVTVTHFSYPTWVDNPVAFDAKTNAFTDGSLGGWTNPATGKALASYAAFLVKEYPEVDWWLTMDEPLVALVAGYMAGVFPPGLTDLDLGTASLPNGASPVQVMQNMIAGHALAYHAMKALRPELRVSFAHNSVVWEPKDPSRQADVDATARVDHAYNLVFLDALTKGDFDAGLVGTGPVIHHPEWANTLDFIGVNYYDRDIVIGKSGFLPPLEAMPCAPAFEGAMPGLFKALGCPEGGPPEAPGMTKILLEYQDRYHLPQLVTESGFIDTPENKAARLVQILGAMRDAMDQGANVLGYSYWTLNYDYEWNDGWTQNMGLYTIAGFGDGSFPGAPDGGAGAPGPTTDFTRVPLHPFVDVYAEIAGKNMLPGALILKYAAPVP